MKDNFRIAIFILPNGEVSTGLETQPGLPTSIHGMALFSKLEPEIDRFKVNIRKAMSAHREPGARSNQ